MTQEDNGIVHFIDHL